MPPAARVEAGAASRPMAGLDLDALGRVVGEVAPTLPPDHRRSLASVFRALAQALEVEPPLP